MKFFSGLKTFSLISLVALSIILLEQTAKAETTTKLDRSNHNEINQKTDSSQADSAVKSEDFQQLTSASNLNSSSNSSQTKPATSNQVAQSDIEIEPGRSTRSGSSYIGIGGNIGIDGDTAIGQNSFAVISKLGLTNKVSFRPSALIDEDVTFLLPVTVDFFGREVPDAQVSVAPYVGGGVVLSTGDNDNIGLLATGGLDIPLSNQFTANAAVNFKFIDNTDIGLQLGLGYNFQ